MLVCTICSVCVCVVVQSQCINTFELNGTYMTLQLDSTCLSRVTFFLVFFHEVHTGNNISLPGIQHLISSGEKTIIITGLMR